MENLSLGEKIIRFGEKHNIDQLKKLIGKSSTKDLTKVLTERLAHKDGCVFWNYLLQSFDTTNYESREKRFACVKCFLDCLLKVEFSYKQAYDLTTRLCQDLATFSGERLVQILEHCIDGIRAGDPKCISWKDLLPETLSVLGNIPQINVNGITMSGSEYRDTTMRNLCAMRWPNEVLTPIADMFKEMNLDGNYLILLLNKFSNSFHTLTPSELPALSFQLFSICNTASQIIIPILGLEKYFHRFYYKKLFADMNSNSTDFESIDSFSDKELREAEETILHHLNYCTQYKISELQMGVVLKNFSSLPDVVLTPFVLSALLTMTTANREPDVRLSTSILLHFLRTVIKNNEDERTLSEYSVWCRDSLQNKQVNLEEVFTVLIDQNKDGKDVITPGFVNLVFILLKAKNSTLNNLAIAFLTKFIRKRFVFGQGIVKKLAEWMIVEQDSPQYSECLTLLSVADTFTVSECLKTIHYVMDFFTWIPGEQAMRMMSFILPILKISPIVRDALIEVLRKAQNSRDVKTKKMAVYGFCMILKQLNNCNSQRSQLSASGFCTQHSISGFSLMSQATLGSRCNPQRHFDMLTLEIIGLLRNCFTASLDIKLALYEQLQRAVELNPKLVPHVLQFIDWHFRSYFDINVTNNEEDITIRVDKLLYVINEGDDVFEVTDNIGKLILFITHCLVIYEKLEKTYDIREIKRVFNLSLEKLMANNFNLNQQSTMPNNYKRCFMLQHIFMIEGLMAFTLLTSTQKNDNTKKLLLLFKAYLKYSDSIKLLDASKMLHKKSKTINETKDDISKNFNMQKSLKKVNLAAENVWDLDVIEKFLRLLHENIVPFAAPNNTTNALRGNVELVRYVLEVASVKVEGIRTEPDYKQLPHSRRTLKYLTDITKVVYERCISRLVELFKDFDSKTATFAAVCFKDCLLTANQIYKTKFVDVFLKGFDLHITNNGREAATVLQEVIDAFMTNDLSKSDNNEWCTIINLLLQSLEVLYENLTYSNRITFDSYTWLLNFCKNYEVNTKEISFIFKLLFIQRQKTNSGAFFNVIASNLGRVLGRINGANEDSGEDSTESQNVLIFKSITMLSADSCANYLFGTVRRQIENVEYFIIKANNSHYKCRIVPEDDRDICFGNLRSLERSLCSQLVHISNTLVELTNVCIPLGNLMDNLLKLLTQHYVCLKSISKHFINCINDEQLSIQSTKFNILLQVVGKPLPTNIYALITYIEANILEVERRKKSDPQAEKAKVLRETKLIPKLILSIENFNKHVIVLEKKSNLRLANYLHFGTVRDFRIKTSDLKAALVKTLSHSSQIDTDPSGVGENFSNTIDNDDTEGGLEMEAVDNVENDGLCIINSSEKSKATNSKNHAKQILSDDEEVTDEPTPDNGVLENEIHKESATQLLENIAKINKRSKKRSLRDEDKESDVKSAPPPERKKRRCRERKT